VRDDRPFAGKAAPAVAFYYSPNCEGEHPQRQLANYTGIMQADAFSGFDPRASGCVKRGVDLQHDPSDEVEQRGDVSEGWATPREPVGTVQVPLPCAPQP
jgi:hypothetical protein